MECIRLVGRQPQSVCKAWNDGIDKAVEIGCEYILVINEDVVLKHDAVDRIVEFAQLHREAVFWSLEQHDNIATLEQADGDDYSEHPNFEAYLIAPTFFETVGRFDENFAPAYMEDNDMHARIVLSGNIAYSWQGALFYHFGSMTIKGDDQIHTQVDRSWGANCNYFYRKWGHTIVNDIIEMRQLYYQHPYNDPSKPLSYWELGSA
jgi:GT2 family glycosyltransferase